MGGSSISIMKYDAYLSATDFDFPSPIVAAEAVVPTVKLDHNF